MAKPRRSRPKRKAAPASRATTRLRASRKRRAGPGIVTSVPPDALDDFIDAAARVLVLPLEPSWRPAVKANLEVTLRFASFVAAFSLPDEAEPAPVFMA
jgi:hypothetical protein